MDNSPVGKIKERRYQMESRLDEITSSSSTPDKTTSVHKEERVKPKPKSVQKHTITAPKKTNKKHFGKPFNEE